MNELKTKKKCVALIDVYGYSSFIRDDQDHFLNLFDKSIKKCLSILEKRFSNAFEYRMYSDNILIYPTEFGKNDSEDARLLCKLLELSNKIQKTLLVEGNLFSRGSIVIDYFFASDRYVFGDAIIKAHELEKKCRFPFITIDPSILNYFTDEQVKKELSELMVFETITTSPTFDEDLDEHEIMRYMDYIMVTYNDDYSGTIISSAFQKTIAKYRENLTYSKQYVYDYDKKKNLLNAMEKYLEARKHLIERRLPPSIATDL